MKTLEPKVYIVGAGPGDPELITVKGSNILKNADLVLYTDSLVNDELIATAKPEAEVLQSSGMDLEQQVELMCTAVQAGRSVARVHTGDPAMYGAILEQMVLLKQQGVEYEIIPGVSSVFASAAALGAELTVPELTQTVILTRAEGRTPVPEREKLRDLASHHCTVALFLSATLAKKSWWNSSPQAGAKIHQLRWCSAQHGRIRKLCAPRWLTWLQICVPQALRCMR